MKTEIASHLKTIERSVQLGERDGKPTSVVCLKRAFDITHKQLWNAFANKEQLSKWFLPTSGELKEGGNYALTGNASGTILKCVPKSHIALTWEIAGTISWVDIHLSERSDSHSGFELQHLSFLSPHWDQYGAGATGVGYEMASLGLDQYFRDPKDKFTEEDLIGSEEGRAFISECSNGWAQASIQAGTEESSARDAARRTTAFYTGIDLGD